jgi:hypothetical protein
VALSNKSGPQVSFIIERRKITDIGLDRYGLTVAISGNVFNKDKAPFVHHHSSYYFFPRAFHLNPITGG